MKTLKDLVESGLRAGGFDGLCNPCGGCACHIDDLAPCGSPSFDDCAPGYVGPCDGRCIAPPCEYHVYTALEDLERAKRGEAERLENEI